MKQRLTALEKKSAKEGIVLTEAQVQALECKKQDDEAHGEIESHHPGSGIITPFSFKRLSGSGTKEPCPASSPAHPQGSWQRGGLHRGPNGYSVQSS